MNINLSIKIFIDCCNKIIKYKVQNHIHSQNEIPYLYKYENIMKFVIIANTVEGKRQKSTQRAQFLAKQQFLTFPVQRSAYS